MAGSGGKGALVSAVSDVLLFIFFLVINQVYLTLSFNRYNHTIAL